MIAVALVFTLAIGAWLQATAGAGAAPQNGRAIPVGALFQLPRARGCVSELASDGCQRGRGLAGAGGVAIAGRYVYVASVESGAVAIFRRSRTGALTA